MSTPDDQLKPEDQLQPGAGRPLVEGPPASVGEPIADRRINFTAGVSGLILLGAGGVIAVILLVVLLFAILGHIH
jgi:hypothetical protein